MHGLEKYPRYASSRGLCFQPTRSSCGSNRLLWTFDGLNSHLAGGALGETFKGTSRAKSFQMPTARGEGSLSPTSRFCFPKALNASAYASNR